MKAMQDEYGKAVPLTWDIVRSRGWNVLMDSGLVTSFEHPEIAHGHLTRAPYGWVWLKPGQIIWDGRTINYLHELIAAENAKA